MALKLDIPLFRQPTHASCWWAAELMILRHFGLEVKTPSQIHSEFRRPAKRPSIEPGSPPPSDWLHVGVPAGELGKLARLTGFRPLPRKPAKWDSATIEKILWNNGPFWFYGNGSSRPEAIVLTGVDETSVYLNDPAAGCRVRENLDCFRQRMRLVWDLPENPLCYYGFPSSGLRGKTPAADRFAISAVRQYAVAAS